MADQVTGNEGDPITHDLAKQWMNRYIASVPAGTVQSELFGINKLNELLKSNGSDVKGIRVCYSLDADNKPRIIIYAVNSKNEAQFAYILENGRPCPPYCSTNLP